uniref:Uncharacterized protein n=1 Tax=Rhizophora mucronata TaxID=61149 RepID=A0A2P2P9C4_RHIMU
MLSQNCPLSQKCVITKYSRSNQKVSPSKPIIDQDTVIHAEKSIAHNVQLTIMQ